MRGRELFRRLMQLADLRLPRWLIAVLSLLPLRAIRQGFSAFQVRLAGAALCTAGLAFIGFGTLGTAATQSGGLALTGNTTPACSTGHECLHNTTASSDCTGMADLLNVASLDSTDSYWHFVIPKDFLFVNNPSSLTFSFSGGSVEKVTYVQAMSGGFKGIVVETDGGTTLNFMSVTDAGTTETTEAEYDGSEGGEINLSSTCPSGTSSTTSSSHTSSTPASSSQTSSRFTTTKTITAPGSTVTTTITGPTSTTTAPGTTKATTLTNATTQKETITETVPTTITVTTVSGNTVTKTLTTATIVVTTVTVAGEGSTKTVTNSTTVTVPTTVTVTGGTPGSSASSSSSTTHPSSTAAGVLPAETTTPTTGADLEFGVGIVLLVTGGGLLAFAARITRRT